MRRTIRFYLLKLAKRLARGDDERPVVMATQQTLDIGVESAFEIFRNKRFRELAQFQKLSQVEHDRIWNELEVTGICLALFCLEHLHAIIKPEDFHFWRRVKERLPREFEERLLSIGVESADAHLLRGLIDMRYGEYADLIRQSWEIWDREEPAFRALPHDTARHSVARAHALAIGTADHIMRGKLTGSDLPRFLRGWLLFLNESFGRFVVRL